MSETLVELLDRFSRRVSTEAAYLASMVLRYRLAVDDLSASKVINKGTIAQPKEEVRQAALLLLQQIEKSAGNQIASFDKKTAEKYLKDLAKVVRDRAMSDLQYQEKKGQEILKSLRNGEPLTAR